MLMLKAAMLATMLATMLAATTAAAREGESTTHVDTTFAVKQGTRLEVDNFGGSVTVHAWGRDAVKLEANRPNQSRIEVSEDEGVLSLRSIGRMGVPGTIEYTLQVPRWMELRIAGVMNDVSVDGVEAPLKIGTVKGDVAVRGGKEFLELQTVQGVVKVEHARGRVTASSVNEGITLDDVEGEIQAETVNGLVRLVRVRSRQVDCSSVNGSLEYEGEIQDGGHYSFTTHNGDITVVLPGKPSADISVSTFNGGFESGFPVTLSRGTHHSRRFRFTLGSGGADLELESFQGTIRLRRAGRDR